MSALEWIGSAINGLSRGVRVFEYLVRRDALKERLHSADFLAGQTMLIRDIGGGAAKTGVAIIRKRISG